MQPRDRVLALKRDIPKSTCFYNNDTSVAVGTDSGKILILPLIEHQALKKLPGHKLSVTCMDSFYGFEYIDMNHSFHTNDILISGSKDQTVMLWREQNNISTIRPDDGEIVGLSCAQERPVVLIVGEDRCPSVWNFELEKCSFRMKQFAENLTSCAMAHDSNKFIIGSNDGNASIVDARSGELVVNFISPDSISSVAYNSDCNLAAIGCVDGSITTYDMSYNQMVIENDVHESKVVSIIIHPEGNMLVSSSEDKTIHFSCPHKLVPKFTIKDNPEVLTGLSWSRHAGSFVSSSIAQKVYIFATPDFEREDLREEEDKAESVSQQQIIGSPRMNLTGKKFKSYPLGDYMEEEEKGESNLGGGDDTLVLPSVQTDPRIGMMNVIFSKLFELQDAVDSMTEKVNIMDQQIVQIQNMQNKIADAGISNF